MGRLGHLVYAFYGDIRREERIKVYRVSFMNGQVSIKMKKIL